MTVLLVVLGGAFGAVSRFLIDRAVTARTVEGQLPTGTLLVNLAGSLLLGLLAGAGSTVPGWLGLFVGTGFCGALTTWSTFGYETVRLARSGPAGRRWAVVNVAVTLGAGLTAAAAGWAAGSRL
ncbi:fluoride efflux transporter CrcB [Micromonospora sp. CPCC 206060]|uniref:fluoride efflux transporter CrcB n=1 Tax=Micromonospora sp. CPCC 206060 TaxID=3122406 RepID=UPI002FF2B729